MKFSINGVEQSSGVTNNGNGTWSFNWNITTLADGNYTIGAAAIDALGTRGPPRSLTVKLARGPATPPQNVTGGYNYVYVSGVKTLVVELGWDASPEGSVTGYEVRNGATVECSASLATECTDLTAASSGLHHLPDPHELHGRVGRRPVRVDELHGDGADRDGLREERSDKASCGNGP